MHPEDLLKTGRTQLDQGDYTSALESFQQAASQDPTCPDAHYYLGLASYRLERYDQALHHLDQALTLHPTHIPALTRRGLTHQKLHHPEPATADFTQAIALDPTTADDWHNRGIALDELQRYEEAIAAYDQALAIKPDGVAEWCHESKITILGRADIYQTLPTKIHIRIQQRQPDDHDTWYGQGNALGNLGRYEEAIASYDQALSIKPDYHYAWYYRGIALSNLGRYEEAIESYDRAVAIKPDFHEAWNNRGITLDNLGRYEEAIESYDQAVAIKPDYHMAWCNRGNTLDNLGRYEEAMDSYDRTVAIKPDFHEAWCNRGVALGNLNRHKEAIESYDRAVAIKPDFHEAWNNRGNALDNLGRYAEAITSYDRAVAIKPDFYEAWNNRGITLGNLGRNEEAMDSYDRTVAIKPDFHEAWTNKAIAYESLLDYDAALTALQQGSQTIQSLQPQTPVRCYGRAWLLYQRGNLGFAYGQRQQSATSFDTWLAARADYQTALALLDLNTHPELRLQTWQGLLRVSAYLGGNAAIQPLLEPASNDLAAILQSPVVPLGVKLRLRRQFAEFAHYQVDILGQQGRWQEALAAAERRKASELAWWQAPEGEITEAQSTPTDYAALVASLPADSAAIYWHLSPTTLTTLILKPAQDPIPLVPASSQPTALLVPGQRAYPATARQVTELEAWLQDWRQHYQAYQDCPPAEETQHPWRQRLPAMVLTRLRQILNYPAIWAEVRDARHLVLIPHRDLHLIPLHLMFNRPVTYLPSLSVGRALYLAPPHPTPPTSLLTVVDPPSTLKHKSSRPLLFTELEADLIAQRTLTIRSLHGAQATEQAVQAALAAGVDILHITGHGYHDLENPRNSALALAGDAPLTLAALFTPAWAQPLSQVRLVCLAACETGITSPHRLTDDYVGLVSGFLAVGVCHVVSTLWTVNEEASALLMIRFYQVLQGAEAWQPHQALYQAQQWLKELTCTGVAQWCDEVVATPPPVLRGSRHTLRGIAETYRQRAMMEGETFCPFEHPYYWAGFIISGQV